jgi:hypothetical protein
MMEADVTWARIRKGANLFAPIHDPEALARPPMALWGGAGHRFSRPMQSEVAR